ncbi:helicase associated domain-containing protein, partial [Embleya sp. NPDC055610]
VRAGLRPGQVRQLDALGITAETEHGHGAVAGEGGAAGGDGVEDGVAAAAGVGGARGRGGRNGTEEGGAVVGGDGAGAAPVPRRGRGAWETGFAAAVAYREREGHLDVPRAHVETVIGPVDAADVEGAVGGAAGTGEVVEVRLGKWVNNQRTRRNSLNEERVRLLTELGMRW